MDNSATILLLVNPLAKKKKTNKIVKEIVTVLSGRKISFVTFTEVWPEEINFYKEVWIIGGDGTLNYFLNFYNSIEIPIVIFKGGTGNDFATRLYGKLNTTEQINKVIDAAPQYVDAAECNGRKFINGVGVGFDGEVLQSINAIRILGGHLGYLGIVLKKIFSFKELFYQIKYEGTAVSEKFLLVMVTNSSSTGGGFMVSPEAVINDGKLNMVLCKALPILKRLKNLPIIEKGKHLNKEFIFHKIVSNVLIECEEETLAQIDGELISARSFDIKVLPGCYLFKF